MTCKYCKQPVTEFELALGDAGATVIPARGNAFLPEVRYYHAACERRERGPDALTVQGLERESGEVDIQI